MNTCAVRLVALSCLAFACAGAAIAQTIRYVDPAGNDAGNDCTVASVPCKTVTRATTVAVAGSPGDVVRVAPGTYNVASGETFPIQLPSGVQLTSSAGAAATILDGTGAQTTVIRSLGPDPSTMIRGFTITGGFGISSSNKAGALYLAPNSRAVIDRNIFVANESDGGAAGIFADQPSSVTITNNLFINNISRGAKGESHIGEPGDGGHGRGAMGVAIFAFGLGAPNPVIEQNTFYGNQAIGGDGGDSTSGTGGTGGATEGSAIWAARSWIRNNIFSNNLSIRGHGGSPGGQDAVDQQITVEASDPSFVGGNLYFQDTPSFDEATAIVVDPQFHQPPYNLHIRRGSPAASAGDPAYRTDVDFDGVVRAGVPAVGAYEPSGIAADNVLSSSASPSPLNGSVTFTANVSSTLGTPSGTVTFLDGGALICANISIAAGVARCTTASLTARSHAITAQYSGDALYASGTSNTVIQVVDAMSVDLSLGIAGPGQGAVVSTPSGIFCPGICTTGFTSGSAVTLEATAQPGSVFAGWSGGGCTGTGLCTVTMTSALLVTATFNAVPSGSVTLTTNLSGTGAGRVTSAPAGVDCGSTCVATFASGTTVTLSATPSPGSTFAGWLGGGCSGVGPCSVALNAATSATAVFMSVPQGSFALSVTKSGSGGGTVNSSRAGIACGPDCSEVYTNGTVVSLSAIADASSEFSGWSGGGCSGTLTCDVTLTSSSVVNATFTAVPRIVNLSTRAKVGTGNDVMIAGFVIGGSTSKTVAIVATGPSLSAYGVANALANPTLTLVRSADQSVIATNDDWQTAANASQLQVAGLAPPMAAEPALLVTLQPGAYTAVVSGAGNTTGVSVVAVYELDQASAPLPNLSTRGQVLAGENVMIGGFVIDGNAPKTVAIVGTGPSLAAHGIADALADPMLTLVRSSDQSVIATNDDWQNDANASQLQAAGLAPSDAKEAAIYVTLPPGAYTAVLSGAGGGTGVGVIAVYAR